MYFLLQIMKNIISQLFGYLALATNKTKKIMHKQT